MKISKKEILTKIKKVAIGIFPGMNRSRKFKDKKKEANRKACRGRVKRED